PPTCNEDPGNGLAGAVGILLALVARRRTGEGCFVENPQINAAMAHMAHAVRRTDGTVVGAGLLDPVQLGTTALHRLYQTADGWVWRSVFADGGFTALSKVLGLDLSADERFADRASRAANDDALAALLLDAFGTRVTADVLRDLDAAGVAAAEPKGSN